MKASRWIFAAEAIDVNDGGCENEAQQNYIQGYIQRVEDALYGEGFVNEGGEHLHDMMDMESAARYWLVNQLSNNLDAYATGSTYVYKKRDTEDTPGKLFWGPLWDFDFA